MDLFSVDVYEVVKTQFIVTTIFFQCSHYFYYLYNFPLEMLIHLIRLYS